MSHHHRHHYDHYSSRHGHHRHHDSLLDFISPHHHHYGHHHLHHSSTPTKVVIIRKPEPITRTIVVEKQPLAPTINSSYSMPAAVNPEWNPTPSAPSSDTYVYTPNTEIQISKKIVNEPRESNPTPRCNCVIL